jgi:hypothetical protein
METKPFSIQSPEAIAKEYGGNKQKIAQAMQMGIIDPTAGMLAGMFIDRMRAAAQQEQVPEQTIAQQVFAPPAPPAPPAPMGAPPAGPPAGLGATPEAAQMMAPPMEQPMGMAPPMEQAMAPPPMEQPMGMAEGGMVPPYMNNGGLAELPVPEDMFSEPNNGGYAGGGIVAFAGGEYIQQGSEDGEVTVNEPGYGFGSTFEKNMALTKKYAPQQNKYGDRLASFYEAEMSPETQKKRRNEDLGAFLMNLGGNLASTTAPGGFLPAAGKALMATAPGLELAKKERRAEQRDAIKTLAAREDMTNKQATDAFRLAGELQKAYGGFMDTGAQRNLTREMNEADNETRMAAQVLANQGSAAVAGINKSAQLDFFTKQEANLIADVKAKAIAALGPMRSTLDNEVGRAYNLYRQAVAEGNEAKKKEALTAIATAENAFVQSQVALLGGSTPPSPGKGARGSGTPQLPPGFSLD